MLFRFCCPHNQYHICVSVSVFVGIVCLPTTSLISDVLQRGSNVDLLGPLVHPVQHHVDEHVGPTPAHSIAERKKNVSHAKRID